jgi:hypothetical protein
MLILIFNPMKQTKTLGLKADKNKLTASTYSPGFYFRLQYLLLFCVIQLLVWACTDSKGRTEEVNAEMQVLIQENDSLMNQIHTKNRELDEITSSMNQIESNLEAIRKNEVEIENLKKQNLADVQEKINKLIEEIDLYVEDNRTKVAVLEHQMQKTKNKSMGLSKLVAQQKRTVFEKENQIQNLLVTINSLKQELISTINTKNAEIYDKQRIIEEREARLNTAYYTFGDRQTLTDNGIIRKEGGVLGAGKTYKLASKFDVNAFKKVNIREVSQIDIGIVDKKNVVTSHPADSYYFVKTSGRTLLKILDQQKFWSVSKFLVIETEGGL